jgi:hypothetical protein
VKTIALLSILVTILVAAPAAKVQNDATNRQGDVPGTQIRFNDQYLGLPSDEGTTRGREKRPPFETHKG